MNSQKHKSIIYFVAITIVATIAIQLYWNYINYQNNKAELVNQVQVSLDNAVEAYYANIARKHVVTVVTTDSINNGSFNGVHNMLRHINSDSNIRIETDTLIGSRIDTVFKFKTNNSDSRMTGSYSYSYSSSNADVEFTTDSIEVNMLATKLFVSMNEGMIGSPQLAKLLEADFISKNWPIDFGLLTRNNNCNRALLPCDSLQTFGTTNEDNQLVAYSQSTFLPANTQLEIHFSNITSILLNKSLIGILLSLLLSSAIVFCLLYLLKIINQQKQLAEIKDDLISNITHEFKTPITTVGAALEGIENFNGQNDIDKTKKYINISNQQLKKLNTMVEKLLETASLDSESLSLQLENKNIVLLINQQLEKYKMKANEKELIFNASHDEIIGNIDVFHFENAIENLIDNAIKYGGDIINIQIQNNNTIEIIVEDNGSGIAKDQQVKIFDKFYRIPTGNIHDVKGFGIGLYYAKNIIEKHGGELILMPNKSTTSFKITLPNGH